MAEETKTPVEAAMEDVNAKTKAVADARKALDAAKVALAEARKDFDRAVRAATK